MRCALNNYKINANARLIGSLTLSMLYFLLAVGTAAVQNDKYFSATADAVVTPNPIANNEPLSTITGGRSLGYNLLVASGLSVLTTYFFLKRYSKENSPKIVQTS